MSEDWGDDFVLSENNDQFHLPSASADDGWGDDFSFNEPAQPKLTKIAVVDTEEDWGDFFSNTCVIATPTSSSSVSPSLPSLPAMPLKTLSDNVFSFPQIGDTFRVLNALDTFENIPTESEPDAADIAPVLNQFKEAVAIYKTGEISKAFVSFLSLAEGLNPSSPISDIFKLRLQYLLSTCSPDLQTATDCIDNAYSIICDVFEDPINDDYSILCSLVYLQLYKRCMGQNQSSPKFDYITESFFYAYGLIQRKSVPCLELIGTILCFICTEVNKYDRMQIELIEKSEQIIQQIILKTDSQAVKDEFNKYQIAVEAQKHHNKSMEDRRSANIIKTPSSIPLFDDEEVMDWDKEFGITTQTTISTFKDEENVLEKCKILEQINEETDICLNYDAPSVMYGKFNGKKKLQANDLVNHFEKTLKEVKKWGITRKTEDFSKSVPNLLNQSIDSLSNSKENKVNHKLIQREIQYHEAGLKELDDFLDYLDSLKDTDINTSAMKLIDEMLVSLGYSPVTFSYMGRTDIEVPTSLFTQLGEVYENSSVAHLKPMILFAMGIYCEERQDYKKAEGCFFESVYILSSTNAVPLKSAIGLESLLHYAQVLFKLNKRSYISHVLDLIYRIFLIFEEPLRIIQTIADIALQLHSTLRALVFFRYLLHKYTQKTRTNEMLSTVRTLSELYYTLGSYETAIAFISPRFFTHEQIETLHLLTLPLYRANCIRYAELVLRHGNDKEVYEIERYLGNLFGDEGSKIALLKAKAHSKKGQITPMVEALKQMDKTEVKNDEYYIHTINDKFSLSALTIAAKGYLRANAPNSALTLIDIILICIRPTQFNICSQLFLMRGKALHSIYMSSTQQYPSDLHDYLTPIDLFNFYFDDITMDGSIIPVLKRRVEDFHSSVEVLQEMVYSMNIAFSMAEEDANEYLQSKITICKAEVLNDVLLRWPESGLEFNQSQRVLFYGGTTLINESGRRKITKKDEFVIDAKETHHSIEKVVVKVCDVVAVKQMASCYVLLSETSYLQNNKSDAYSYIQLAIQLIYGLILDGSHEISSNISPTTIRFLYNILQRSIRIVLIFGKEIINSNYPLFDTYNMLSNLLHRQMRGYSTSQVETDKNAPHPLKRSEKRIELTIAKSKISNQAAEISEIVQSFLNALSDNARLGLTGRFRYDQVKEWNKTIIQTILRIQQQVRTSGHNIPPLGVITRTSETKSIFSMYTTQKNVQRKQSQTNQLLHRNMTYILPLYNAIVMYHTFHQLFVFSLSFDTELQPPKAPQYNQMVVKVFINKSHAIFHVSPTISIESFLSAVSKERDKKRGGFTLSSKKPKLLECSKSFIKELKDITKNSNVNGLQLFRNSAHGQTSIKKSLQTALYLCFTATELKHANAEAFSTTPAILYLNKRLTKEQSVKKGIVIDKNVMGVMMVSLTKISGHDNVTKLQTDVKEWMNKSFGIVNETITSSYRPMIICNNVLSILPWEYLSVFTKAIRFTSFEKYKQINVGVDKTIAQQPPIIVVLRSVAINMTTEDQRRDMVYSQIMNDLSCTDEPLKLSSVPYKGFFVLPEARQLVSQYPNAVMLKDIDVTKPFSEQLQFLTEGKQYVILISVTDLVEFSDLLAYIAERTTVGIACLSKIRGKKLAHLPRHIKQISESSPQTSVRLKYDYVNFILSSLKGNSCYPSVLLNLSSE